MYPDVSVVITATKRVQLCDDLAALRLVAAVVHQARQEANPRRSKRPLTEERRRRQQQANRWLTEFLTDTDDVSDLWPTENPSYRHKFGAKLV